MKRVYSPPPPKLQEDTSWGKACKDFVVEGVKVKGKGRQV